MAKHTQTTRRQLPTNCLRVFDHFVELAQKGLRPCQTSLNEFSCKKMLTARSCESFFQQKNRVKNYRSSYYYVPQGFKQVH